MNGRLIKESPIAETEISDTGISVKADKDDELNDSTNSKLSKPRNIRNYLSRVSLLILKTLVY